MSSLLDDSASGARNPSVLSAASSSPMTTAAAAPSTDGGAGASSDVAPAHGVSKKRSSPTRAARSPVPTKAGSSLYPDGGRRPFQSGRATSRSIHQLLRERQRRGSVRFLAREGAGVWSPDPLQRTFASEPHTLKRLQLSGELRGHMGCVNTVSCTPDGRYWITGSDDTKLMVRLLL